jgi:ribosome biogenesis GTPase
VADDPKTVHDSKAASVGRREQSANRSARLGDLDDADLDLLPSRERHGQRRSEGIGRRAGKLRTAPPAAADDIVPAATADTLVPGEAVVVAITRGQCEIELGGETLVCHLPKALALAQQSELAVGDRIRAARRPAGDLVAAQVLPRANRLSRPDPFLAHRERILAANIDLALVVVAIRKPALAVGLVDRFLVALAHGGVPAAIAVNKVDLAESDRSEDPELEALAPYAGLGVPVVLCSTRTGEGIDELRALLGGKTAVFVGHSGVGKSSLLRALAPEFEVRVAGLSSLNDRGRHTTTGARIYTLDDGVTRIVDTPGVREFGLWKMTPRELAAYFDEFDEFAVDCRFADCTHTHEPGCAVQDAVEAGRLAEARYDTYLRIFASLDEA